MAGKINVLGFDVANMIAAGEVVDRPASAVKELVENALDAGAKNVTVEIRRGGIGSIRVSDNGSGIDADDVPLAVLRHATSKIKNANDLDSICTLGFRGEALAAISAVSHLKILTKTSSDAMGTMLVCDGGEIIECSETGCAPGTTVIAEELFYNVPARRKFMKKDSTEAAAVTAVMEKMALSSPDVAMRYICDGELKFSTPGDGKLYGAAYVIFGRNSVSRLIPVDRSESGIRVSGFTSEPDYLRSNHNMQYFFINGRYVRSHTVTAAVDQAYSSRLPKERFAFCILNIDIAPGLVDVNVHPSKLEVKFTNERLIFESVYYALLSALTESGSMPELTVSKGISGKFSGTSKYYSDGTPATDVKSAASPSETKRPGQPAPQIHSLKRPESSESPESPESSESPENGRKSLWVTEEDERKLKNPFKSAGGNQINLPFGKDGADQISGTSESSKSPASESLEASESPEASHKAPAKSKELSALSAKMEVSSVSPDAVPSNPEPVSQSKAAPESDSEVIEESSVPPNYSIIGEAYNCYIIVEMEDRLIFIDKHAAHERIIFDELCRKLHESATAGQLLMFPLKERITSAEADAAEMYRESFEKLGFSFECTGGGEVIISSVPEEIGRDGAADMFISLAGKLSDGIGTIDAAGIEFFEKKLYQASCKAAIKGGRAYCGGEVKYICEKLLCRPANSKESAIKTCPHGRPVAFELRKNSIERQFSRLT